MLKSTQNEMNKIFFAQIFKIYIFFELFIDVC